MRVSYMEARTQKLNMDHPFCSIHSSGWHHVWVILLKICSSSQEKSRHRALGTFLLMCPGILLLTGHTCFLSLFCHTLISCVLTPEKLIPIKFLWGSKGVEVSVLQFLPPGRGCRPYQLEVVCFPTTVGFCGSLAGLRKKNLRRQSEKSQCLLSYLFYGRKNVT